MIAQFIINNNFSKILELFSSGRTNTDIVSIILCETYFRCKFDRVIEYLALPLLFFFNRSRVDYLSVGIGQIQIRYWKSFYGLKVPFSMESYNHYFSIKSNYDIAESILHSKLYKMESASKLIALYRGETRKFHLDLFNKLKPELELFKGKMRAVD